MIDAANATYAGVVAGGLVAIAFAFGRTAGLRANSELMLGTFLVGSSTSAAWLTGASISVLVSAGVGLAYAAGFEYVLGGAGLGAGMVLAVVHTAVSGFALAAMPAVHPAMRMRLAFEPGVFKTNYGPLDAGAFVVLHLGYGALFGAIYSPMAVAAHG
jgi:hypothetical protein